MYKIMKGHDGFTLLELIVVIVAIIILLVVVFSLNA